MRIITFLSFLLCITPIVAQAGIYKWTDENGQVHYGQSAPNKSAKEMDLKSNPSKPGNSDALQQRLKNQEKFLRALDEEKQFQKKVKQEEEVLDMETYYDNKKEAKAETDRLAKLAKYRHELAGDKNVGLESPEGEIEAGPQTDMEPDGYEPSEDEEISMSRYDGRYGSRGRGAGYVSRAELGDIILRALRRQ